MKKTGPLNTNVILISIAVLVSLFILLILKITI